MFLRKQIKNDKPYYSLVRTFRQDGKVKQEMLGIGTTPSLYSFKWSRSFAKSYYKNPKVKKFDQLLTDEQKEKIYRVTPDLTTEYNDFLEEKRQEITCRFNAYKSDLTQCTEPRAENDDSRLSSYCKLHQEVVVTRDNEAKKYANSFFAGFLDISKESELVILGLKEEATQAEIKTRYRELAKKLHPDQGGDAKMFALVHKAYMKLTNSGKESSS